MIKITGKIGKSEIANAIQKYNGAEIYSYGDFFTTVYRMLSCREKWSYGERILQLYSAWFDWKNKGWCSSNDSNLH